MNTDKSTPELFTALSEAQGEIQNAEKNSENPHFRSRYADLAQVLNTIRPVFSKHGLSLIQSPEFDGVIASVTTIVAHKSGGFITGKASCVPRKQDPQGIGDSTTYLRRYSAASFAGISQEDDDGESQSHGKVTEPKKTPEPPVVGEVKWEGEFIIKREEKPFKASDGTHKIAWVYTTSTKKVCGTQNPEVDALVKTLLSNPSEPNGTAVDMSVKPIKGGKSFELMDVNPAADDIIP